MIEFLLTDDDRTSIIQPSKAQGGPNGRDPQNPREPDQGRKGETGEIRNHQPPERRSNPEAITPDGRLTGGLSGATAQAGEASVLSTGPALTCNRGISSCHRLQNPLPRIASISHPPAR